MQSKMQNCDNLELKNIVEKNSPLKEWLVTYAGEKYKPEDDIVTVEMIISMLADDFPEVVLALSEENFIRGYEQAVNDLYEEKKQEN